MRAGMRSMWDDGLAKVASGGELSRISLAISVIAASATPVQTLIFDEVDAGIGGAVADVVGRRLKQLGQLRQVLCVTHLPQVAAHGDRHLVVTKVHGPGHRPRWTRSHSSAPTRRRSFDSISNVRFFHRIARSLARC